MRIVIGVHSDARPDGSRSDVMIVSAPLAEKGLSYCEIW